MQHHELIPHLFRTEFRKITAVLCKHFGIDNIQIAEDMLAFEMENAIRDHFGLHAEIREWTADSQDSGGDSKVNSKNQETKLFFSQSAPRYFGEIPFAC